MRKIRRTLCLLLTCALLLGALPVTALAAGDDWREITLTSGDCDIHLSKARTEKMVIRAGVDESADPELSVTALILAQGCEISAHFNETVTQVDPSEAEYLLEEFQVDSLEALIGAECRAGVNMLFWIESLDGYAYDVGYPLPNGTVTESWHEDRCYDRIPILTLRENGDVTNYIFVAEDYPVHGEKQLFEDVKPDAYYADAVVWAAEQGLMQGVPGGKFDPDGIFTRGQILTLLARQAGVDTEGGATWYTKGVEWAKEKGVSDGEKPEETITRAELATLLYRCANSPAVSTSQLNKWPDASSIPTSEAASAIAWCVENGIINGTGDGKLLPLGTATRAQVAVMIQRYCTILGD